MVGTVVVSGGAAGIAAARRLHDAGHDVLLVEAKSRLGGRAHSVRLPFNPLNFIPAELGTDRQAPVLKSCSRRDERTGLEHIVVDAGCGWLHSAKLNPWTRLAEHAGFVIDRRSPHWSVQWGD